MRTLVALLFSVALLAAACGSSESASSVVTADDAPASFEDLDFDSPIGDFLGFDFNASDDMEAEFVEMERLAARLTQECMAGLGFEWTPMDTGSMISFAQGDDLPYFSAEWVEKYGFGVTTQWFPQSMVGELVGFPDGPGGPGGPGEMPEDPNREYIEGLTEGEREAFQEALNGEPYDFGPEGPDEDFDFEPRGCQGVAFEQAFSEGPGGNMNEFYESFGDQLDAMEERSRSDPRVVEFNDKVTACVSDSGLVWVDQQELYQRWESDLNSMQAGPGAGDPFAGTGLDPEEMTERELDEFFLSLSRLDESQLTRLAAIQAEEIELAKVVTGCGGGPLNEAVVLGAVRAEFEQDFLDANADALEQYANAGG